MATIENDNHSKEIFASEQNLEEFAPPYTPENFTEEEKSFLNPFFSNVDKPVFAIKNLPPEVAGALCSKYSRSTKSLRRMFLDEYVNPTIYPEQVKGWDGLPQNEKEEQIRSKNQFISYIESINLSGGIDSVIDIQRGRNFFSRWFGEFGDESIAEMAGVHLCFEGVSQIAVKEIEDKRIGISPIEKSTRYVSFSEKRADGRFQFVVPGEIKGTAFEEKYIQEAERLFGLYSKLEKPYLDYIKEKYPKGDDETVSSFEKSRMAKCCDDLGDLLPFGTQTNVALYGNARAYEALIYRLLAHPVGENRYWGFMAYQELTKIIPSLLERIKTDKGQAMIDYRKNLLWGAKEVVDVSSKDRFQELVKEIEINGNFVKLIFSTKNADIEVLTAHEFSKYGCIPYQVLREAISRLSSEERYKYLGRILNIRKLGNPNAERGEVRFRKPPRAFEVAQYLFMIIGKGKDYRDLERNRMLTQNRQMFNALWGYKLENDLEKSTFADEVKSAIESEGNLANEIRKEFPYISQYLVPFAYFQQWYANISARGIYHLVELRTGPQGRPGYRKISQETAKWVIRKDPALFQGLMVDWNDYALARRESEIKKEQKINNLPKS